MKEENHYLIYSMIVSMFFGTVVAITINLILSSLIGFYLIGLWVLLGVVIGVLIDDYKGKNK